MGINSPNSYIGGSPIGPSGPHYLPGSEVQPGSGRGITTKSSAYLNEAMVEDLAPLRAAHESVAQEAADRQARQDATAANAGGNARSQHRLTTHGYGNATGTTRIDFAVTFVDEPMLTTGVLMKSNVLDFAALPLATVGVYRWITDGRGLYTGAHVWVAISIGGGTSDTAAGYVLEHHLCFEALAIRDVSYDAIMDDG